MVSRSFNFCAWTSSNVTFSSGSIWFRLRTTGLHNEDSGVSRGRIPGEKGLWALYFSKTWFSIFFQKYYKFSTKCFSQFLREFAGHDLKIILALRPQTHHYWSPRYASEWEREWLYAMWIRMGHEAPLSAERLANSLWPVIYRRKAPNWKRI